MENSSQYQNIVALFGKALKMDLSRLRTPEGVQSPIGDRWITLGYFDTLQFYPLPMEKGRTWVQSMWDHNVSCSATLAGDFYYHPLHLTASIAPEEAALYRAFWEAENCPYIFLTMVQAVDPSRLWGHAGGASMESLDRLFDIRPDQENMRHVFYRTMELSDLIVLWRSNEIHNILVRIHDLYQKAGIGDLNTFPSIQYAFLNSFPSSGVSGEKDIFVSTQYTVKDSEKASQFFKNVLSKDSPAFFTTGVEDIRVTDQKVIAADLLERLRRSFLDPANCSLFNQAFLESATQVGIPDDTGHPQPVERNTELETQCETLLARFQDIRGRLCAGPAAKRFDLSWAKAISNLLNALVDMSRNWVMDGFCYLILDAARLFCCEIGKLSVSGEDALTVNQMEEIQRFVRGWGTLMEQATKMDGRFLQMPGFSPALCEIPAKLLEFYLAFTRKAISLMQAGDEEDIQGGRKISLLFVPKICRRVKVKSVFKEDEFHNHLLYVDIPLDQLYSPMETICCLTHEAAHYAGETWRCRKTRKFALLYTLSLELATYLRVNTDTPVRYIYERLRERCPDNGLTASELLRKAYEAMLDLTAGEMNTLLDKFRADVAASGDELLQERIHELQSESVLLSRQFLMKKSYIEDAIRNLTYLFQECYSDLNMILLLRLSPESYLQMALNELHNIQLEGDPRRDPRYYVIVQRWAALLGVKTAWGGRPENPGESAVAAYVGNAGRKEQDPLLTAFCEDIFYLLHADSDPDYLAKKLDSDRRYYFTRETFRHIQRYLRRCAEVICQDLPDDELSRMDEALRYLSGAVPLDDGSFDALINWNRKDLLERPLL